MARGPTFTNYIATDLDPRAGAAYGSLRRVANQTYSDIERSALQASRATERVTSPRVSRQATGEMRQLGTEMRTASLEAQKMSRGLSAVATTLNVVQGPLGPLAGRVSALSTALTELTGVRLGLAGVGATLFAFAAAGNRAAEARSKLQPLYETTQQVNQAFERTVEIAVQAKAPLQGTIDLYSKLTQTGRDFGIEQERINRVTSLAAKSAVLSGGPAQTREAGLFQFGQGLASGQLQGDELRSIRENTTELARAIATGLGVTIGDLKELGAEGVLTTETVVAALERAAGQIEQRFDRVPKTLSTAGTEFSTAFTVLVSNADQAIGVTTGLATALSFVAGNLEHVLSLGAGLGALFVAPKLATFVTGTAAAATAWRTLRQEVAAGNASFVTAESRAAGLARLAREQAGQTVVAERAKQAAMKDTIAGLRLEQASYAQLLPQIERQAEAQRQVVEQQRLARQTGQPYGRGLEESQAALQRTEMARTRTMIAQRGVTQQLEDAEAALAGQILVTGRAQDEFTKKSGAMRAAKAAATKAGQFLAGTMSTLAASLPLMAVGLMVGLVVELATAETSAEAATRRLADAQQRYSDMIDQTTGRARELNAEERKRLRQDTREAEERFQGGDAGRWNGFGFNGRTGIGGQLARELGEGATPAQEQQWARWREMLRQNGDAARDALREIRREAKAGDTGLQQYLASNRDLGVQLLESGAAVDEYRKAWSALNGEIDSGVLERRAQAETERLATFETAVAKVERQIKRANTLGGQNKYQDNLEDIYDELGIPSPEKIETARRSLELLQKKPVPGTNVFEIGQNSKLREGAIQKQTHELNELVRVHREGRPEVERLARDMTAAERAESDRTKGIQEQSRRQREAEEAERARIRAIEDAQRATEKLQSTLDRYDEAPRMIDRAKKDVREIEGLIGATVNGIREITTDNPLGQGQFGTGDYEKARASVVEGLRRPFRDLLRDYEREREYVLLIAEGREAEAEALREKHRLVEQVGQMEAGQAEAIDRAAAGRVRLNRMLEFRDTLRGQNDEAQILQLLIQGRDAEATALREKIRLVGSVGTLEAGQFELLTASAERQERLNRILGERQRITETLTGVVEETRSAVEGLLVDLPSRGLAAGGDFIKNLTRNFRTSGARLLTEQLFGGVDQQVRDLISGKTAVQSATAFAANAFQETGGVARSLTASLAELDAQVAALTSSIRSPTAGAGFDAGLGDRPSAADISTNVVSNLARQKLILPFTGSNSGYGNRSDPFTGKTTFHGGLDFARPIGTAVAAALTGKVVEAGRKGGYGNAVVLDHGNGLRTLYAHLSRIDVKLGDIVEQSGVLGGVGSTGRSTGSHLHFGAYQDGRAIDPRSIGSALISVARETSVIGGRGGLAGGDRVLSIANSVSDISGVIARNQADLSTVVHGVDALGEARDKAFTNAIRSSHEFRQASKQDKPPTLREIYNETGAAIGAKLDNILGTKFLKGIGSHLGNALEGSSYGKLSSSVAGMLGIKQSSTGAGLGGAAGGIVGSIVPGIGTALGGAIGGLLGGTVGGLFKKTKYGASTLTMGTDGEVVAGTAFGNKAQYRQAATGLASGVADSINRVADALDAKISDIAGITLGVRDGDFRVNTRGTSLKTSRGAKDFGEDEAAAVAYAIQKSIERAVITGISQASINILKSGQDLEKAIEKAALIESIPKRLMAIQDPVRYAVEQLNDEFEEIIAALNEGRATAEQYAQAQQLYDLERARAIEAAQQAASSAIQDYLDDMLGGSNSPLNKATVFSNAEQQLNRFIPDIQAGKAVDEGELLDAVNNFRDASRSLKGSSSGFFDDFEMIRALLEKARDNAGVSAPNLSNLPTSPFASPEVQAAISNASNAGVAATNNQTDVLGQKLDAILAVLGGPRTSMGMLPGGRNSLPHAV